MLRFYGGKPIRQGRLGILPAAFDPPTIAHLALADAARLQFQLDQVVFLLPESFPHKKSFRGTAFEQRLALLRAAIEDAPRLAVASLDQGLFIDIARAFEALCGPKIEIYLLCGRDAAERIVGWEYGDGPAITEQLDKYQMLVAPRDGPYEPPAALRSRIHSVNIPGEFAAVSSSAVRQAIQDGRPWEHWTPPPVAELIRAEGLYS